MKVDPPFTLSTKKAECLKNNYSVGFNSINVERGPLEFEMVCSKNTVNFVISHSCNITTPKLSATKIATPKP